MAPATSHRDEPTIRPDGAEPRPEAYMLTRAAVRAVDRAAIEEYGIPGPVLMENAARGLAEAARAMLRHASEPRVVIVCGGGNNGGDGYALARHLHNDGARVTLVPLGTPGTGTDAALNRQICARMGLETAAPDVLDADAPPALVVDAIFGTGLDRAVEGEPAAVIERINELGAPVLAADIPSGLDCDTGAALGATVRATRTVTFVALKPGLCEIGAQEFVGEVAVAGIGAPIELLDRFGTKTPVTPTDPRTPVNADPSGPTR